MSTPALFVSVDTVALRMQVNMELEGAGEVLASAIGGAQMHIEAVLNTDLELKTQDSTFFLDSDAFSGLQPGGVFLLEMPAYFIRQDVPYPISLTYGDRWNTASAAVDMSLVKIDYDKGHIKIDAETYADKYVRVQCATGFLPATDANAAEQLPDWVEEAIVAYVGVVMDYSQTTNRNNEATAQYKRSADHAMLVIQPKMRRKGFVIRPVI